MKSNKHLKSAPMLALRLLNLVIVYELTIAPTVSIADSESVTNTASDILGAASGILGQTQQNQQMNMRVQQQQMQMKAIVPQTFPDSLFPQCKILPAKANRLSGICEEPISSPQEYQSVTSQYAMIAQQNQNAYATFMTGGLKLGSNVGKQCYDEQNKVLQAKLDQRVKSIQGLIAQVEEQNKQFKNEAQKRVNALKDLNAELDGGDGASKGGKTRDFSIFLNNPNCKAVIAQDSINSGKTGLRGLRSNVEGAGLKDAQKILTSKDSIEQDIRAQAAGLKTYLQQNGPSKIADFKSPKSLDGLPTSSSYFTDRSVLSAGLVNKANELSASYSNIESQLASVDGVKIPNSLPANAIVEMKNQVETKKRINMNDCIYANKYGAHSVNLDTLPFEQLGSRSKTTVENFKKELTNLKTKPISPENMLTEIKKLEAKYSNAVTFKLNSSYKGQVTNKDWQLSDIFEGMKQSCENQMNLTVQGEQYSQNDKYKKSYELIAQYEKLNNSMANDLSNAMLNRALNCEGVAYTPSPDTCSNAGAGKLNMASSNFCLKQSAECATNLQACYNLADKVIKTKEAQMDLIAKDHNNAVKIYQGKQDILLKQVGAQFAQQAQMLQGYFPGSKFDLPEGENAFALDIPKEEMDETLGVPMVKTEDYLAQLTVKLKSIKDKVKEQNDSINQMITDRIATLEQTYSTEADYWQGVADKCKASMLAYRQKVNTDNEALMKQQQQQQTDFTEFCYRANAFKATPPCDEAAADLDDAAVKVASRLSQSDVNRLSSIKEMCKGTKVEEGTTLATKDKVKDWCAAQTSKVSACKTYLDNYKKDPRYLTSASAIDLALVDGYPEANEAYLDSIKPSATANIGEQKFVSCNGVNNGTGDVKSTIDQFIKQFGTGSAGVGI